MEFLSSWGQGIIIIILLVQSVLMFLTLRKKNDVGIGLAAIPFNDIFDDDCCDDCEECACAAYTDDDKLIVSEN